MRHNAFENFKRIAGLADMFAFISGKSFDNSFDLIMSTEYGRALASNNPAVMYEQATENLRAVSEELGRKYPELGELFTAGSITEAYISGDFSHIMTSRTEIRSAENLKAVQRNILMKAFPCMLYEQTAENLRAVSEELGRNDTREILKHRQRNILKEVLSRAISRKEGSVRKNKRRLSGMKPAVPEQ